MKKKINKRFSFKKLQRKFMELLEKINNKQTKIGIIGLGYVGLPLSIEYALKGFDTIGFDIDDRKIISISDGRSYIKHIH